MKIMIALAGLLCASTSLAGCPEGTTTIHDGAPVAGYCYVDYPGLYWGQITQACLTSEDHVLAYENGTDGALRLVGLCKASFELRY